MYFKMFPLLNLTKVTFKCLNVLYFRQVTFGNIHSVSRVTVHKHAFLNLRSSFSLHTSTRANKSEVVPAKDKTEKDSTAAPAKKKKKEKLTYITLVEPNDNVTVTTLEDANKLAARRDLKLIKIKDYEAKTERSTYQLMTAAQFLREEKKSKKSSDKTSSKGIKLASISSKINDHDLNAKVKNMMKWLVKENEVRIVITDDNGEAENVYNTIVTGIKEVGRPVQKRAKNSEIRFQIMPVKNPTAKNANVESASSE